MKLLLVEDELSLADSIRQYLAQAGHVVELAGSLEAGLEKAALDCYDCVLLDIMLPDGSGLDIIAEMKRGNSDAGTIVVSARDSLDDKVRGLSLGADDYMTKPFQLAELNARILAVVRRKQHRGQPVVRVGNIEIDTGANAVRVGDRAVDMTRKEYDLLLYLVANLDRVVSKEAIAEHLWGDYIIDADAFDFIYAHMKNLRGKLKKAGARACIRTVYGAGYCMKEPT